MVCSFEDSDKIKEWVELCRLMKEMHPVVRFCFKPTELFIQLKHPSNKTILEITLPSTWFSFYDWTDTDIDLSTDTLFTIFSNYHGSKNITLESEKKYLVIKCFHEKYHKHYSIPLIYSPYKSIMIHFDIGVDIEMETTPFFTLCKELHRFDDEIFFRVKPEYFHMITQDNEKMVVELQSDMFERKVDGSYDNRFYLPYLLTFLKCAIYPKIRVQLGNVLCLYIEKEYTLRYYVCPIKS